MFHKPQQDVQIIPYDNGYYAETTVEGFSEFWINGGGKQQDHPLAAWLKDFTAVALDSSGLLNWSSWQETGSVKFIIEKSRTAFSLTRSVRSPPFRIRILFNRIIFTDPSAMDRK